MDQGKISQERRDYAMRTALATVRLEGLEPSEESKVMAEKVARGEMSHDEVREALLKQYAVSA